MPYSCTLLPGGWCQHGGSEATPSHQKKKKKSSSCQLPLPHFLAVTAINSSVRYAACSPLIAFSQSTKPERPSKTSLFFLFFFNQQNELPPTSNGDLNSSSSSVTMTIFRQRVILQKLQVRPNLKKNSLQVSVCSAWWLLGDVAVWPGEREMGWEGSGLRGQWGFCVFITCLISTRGVSLSRAVLWA